MKEKTVSVFPAVQHRHADGEIVSVTLRRRNGAYSAECAGCQTRFRYQKPRPASRQHFKSPVLSEVKGNFDGGE